MRWKADDETFHLVLVLALEHSWIILCDHGKVLRAASPILGLFRLCIMSDLKPMLWAPP